MIMIHPESITKMIRITVHIKIVMTRLKNTDKDYQTGTSRNGVTTKMNSLVRITKHITMIMTYLKILTAPIYILSRTETPGKIKFMIFCCIN